MRGMIYCQSSTTGSTIISADPAVLQSRKTSNSQGQASMTRPRNGKPASTLLTVGLALFVPAPLLAQSTGSGPGLSSGSGAGTGTGTSSSIQRNPSGSLSGSGPGSTSRERTGGSGRRGGGDLAPEPAPRRAGESSVPLGPGSTTRFPDDPSLLPFNMAPGDEEGALGPSTIPPELLAAARSITVPSERALSLQRIGATAILGNQLDLARETLAEAAKASMEVPIPLVRDQRIIATITMVLNLTDTLLQQGSQNYLPLDESESATPLPTIDRDRMIRSLHDDWSRAVDLSLRISNPTYRNEMLLRVVENQAAGSQTISMSFPRNDGKGADGSGPAESYDSSADRILQDAAKHAARIERPIWRDRAMLLITSSAAASKQFTRGLEVARSIPQAEIRAEALVRISEAQSRGNRTTAASTTYQEALRAVASIPLEDPRDILTGVLIDSLISVGRFEDARASIVLYSKMPLRVTALGAVAESQSRRGLADAAREWINRDVPPQDRAMLHRRVDDGLLTVIQVNRSRELSNQDR